GQFDADVARLSFGMAGESVGSTMNPRQTRQFELEVTGMVAESRLVLSVNYSKKQYKKETINTILNTFKEELAHIISHCRKKEKPERTPSDLTYKGLSIAAMDDLQARYHGGIEDVYTLTPMQEGMLFHTLYEKDASAYFEQMSYRLHGKFAIDLAEKSIKQLVKRYDILRATYVYEGVDRPLQIILKEGRFDFYHEDIDELEEGIGNAREQYIENYKEGDRKRPFHLGKDPLMRVAVIRTGAEEHELIWSHHHILMDGWCIGILSSEFFELYDSYLKNRIPRLHDAPLYRQYIRWLERQDKEVSRNYWKEYLETYRELTSLPGFKNGGANEEDYKNEVVELALDRETTSRINRWSGSNNVTVNTLIQAVWGLMLGRYTCKEDVVFGAVVSGRPSELDGVEAMVGLFINTIPVRIRWEGDTSFQQLARNIQDEAINSEPHHYFPLAEIQSASHLKQNLMDHILVFENYPLAQQLEHAAAEQNEKEDGVKLNVSGVETFEQTNYDFNIAIYLGERLNIKFNYNGNVYKEVFIRRMIGHFKQVIRQILENQTTPIRQLTLLSPGEEREILKEFNTIETCASASHTIHELFRQQAGVMGEQTAIRFNSDPDPV
ncbi:MAG: non-ribosomal peptide synthetase, partial [bacterium]|nr:non-ribosomal peptide synthetase [bacterium]